MPPRVVRLRTNGQRGDTDVLYADKGDSWFKNAKAIATYIINFGGCDGLKAPDKTGRRVGGVVRDYAYNVIDKSDTIYIQPNSGTFALVRYLPKSAEVDVLCTLDMERGAGTRMMNAIMKDALDRGRPRVTLLASRGIEEFYAGTQAKELKTNGRTKRNVHANRLQKYSEKVDARLGFQPNKNRHPVDPNGVSKLNVVTPMRRNLLLLTY